MQAPQNHLVCSYFNIITRLQLIPKMAGIVL